jgi:hypothetical protein
MVGPAPPAEPPLLPPPMLGIPPMPAMPENSDGSKCRHCILKTLPNSPAATYNDYSSYLIVKKIEENFIKN